MMIKQADCEKQSGLIKVASGAKNTHPEKLARQLGQSQPQKKGNAHGDAPKQADSVVRKAVVMQQIAG